ALGCVLYEMLVGEPPYTGSTAQAILGKIIAGELASATKHRTSVPRNVDAAIRKALEKVPADRFSSALEFSKALGDPGFRHGEPEAVVGVAGVRGQWTQLAMATSALSLICGAGFVWALLRPPPAGPVERFSLDISAAGVPAVLPDGSGVVYGQGQLLLRRWDNLASVPIPGTEGADGPTAVSPSGDEVAFVTTARQLKAVPITGGVVRTLAAPVACCVRWGLDGFVYYSPAGSRNISRVPAGGGSVEVVTQREAGDGTQGGFQVLPGGRAGVFTQWGSDQVEALQMASGERKVLTPGINPYVTSTGHLVFGSTEGQILAAPFDAEAMELTGPAVPLIEGVVVTDGYPFFSLSEAGTLVYWIGNAGSGNSELVWVSRSGQVTPQGAEPFNRGRGLEISPDGSRVAYGASGTTSQDIWIQELPAGAASRLTLTETDEYYPHWASDGLSVTYAAFSGLAPGDTLRLYSKRADGTAAATLLTEGEITTEANFVEGVWSPNGEQVVLRRLGGVGVAGVPEGTMDLYVLRPGIDTVASPLIVTTDFAEQTPSISRDGRWLAYTSNESDRPEVFVRPFPDVDAGKWQVSTEGGSHPVWAHNGRELFFYDQGSGELKVAEYATTAAATTGAPVFRRTGITTLFAVPDGAYQPRTFWSFYDVAPDDERLLMERPVGGAVTGVVVLNFFEELKRLVPN
ncbi:MAG: hypothetical protein OEO79_19225, partial [Gemmatimonadota bacterium]|nr:hypothetical protein [Gemmatimonadota bacterium]